MKQPKLYVISRYLSKIKINTYETLGPLEKTSVGENKGGGLLAAPPLDPPLSFKQSLFKFFPHICVLFIIININADVSVDITTNVITNVITNV